VVSSSPNGTLTGWDVVETDDPQNERRKWVISHLLARGNTKLFRAKI
jgi:hypothetical protein